MSPRSRLFWILLLPLYAACSTTYIGRSDNWAALTGARRAASRSGWRRIAGIAAGWEEGLELNLLGLTFGVDPLSLSLKLPLLGRVGPSESEPVIFD